MNYILSICIPSNGRIATLNKNMEYLKNIIINNNIQNYVQVVISDSAANVNNFIKSQYNLSFVNYYHAINNGHDKNILNVVSKSSGKYIWLCQDHTKIYEISLLKILKILKKNTELKYIFASTKENYQLDCTIKEDNRLIGFRCIYLNTNIIEKKSFLEIYLKLIDEFNGSHVVFQHCIIYILLNLKKNYSSQNNFLILKDKNSAYRYFETNFEHSKFTWSNDLINYLNIISLSRLMIDDIQKKFNLNDGLINKIYKKRDISIQTVFKIGKLLKFDNYKKNYDKKIIENIYNHPKFYKLDIFFLKLLLRNNYLILFFLKYFFLSEFYLLIFLPSFFFQKLFIKLKSFIK